MEAAKLTSERRTDINNPNLIALLILPQQWHRIRNHDLAQCIACIQLLDCIPAQYPMRHHTDDLSGAVLGEHFGCCAQGAAGIGHVVYQDGCLAAYFASECHAGDLTGSGALFAGIGD